MPRKPNTFLRLVVPVLGILIAFGVAVGVFLSTASGNANRQGQAQSQAERNVEPDIQPADQPAEQPAEQPEAQPPAQADAPEPQLAEQPAPTAAPAAQSSSQPAPDNAPPGAQTDAPQPAFAALAARTFPGAPRETTPLGSLDEATNFRAQVRFNTFGAGIESLQLTREYDTVAHERHIELQAARTVNGVLALPFAALRVEIDGSPVDLTGAGRDAPVWRETAPGSFEAIIADDAGNDVLRIVRTFTLEPDRYDVRIRQTLQNRSNRSLSVRLIETGPIDLAKSANRYGGDKRRLRYGYLLQPQSQLTDFTVQADNELANHRDIIGKRENGRYAVEQLLWPTDRAADRDYRLVWAAYTDRYFAVAVHPLVDPDSITAPEQLEFDAVESLDRLVVNPGIDKPEDAVSVVRMTRAPLALAPGASADASLGVYAGPMSRPIVASDPMMVALGLDRIVVYNFGGCMAGCTSQSLAHGLLWVLRLAHDFTGDWAIAIIILVLLVRTCLHPITRWSQIRMQRFGAQMQGISPKMTKIKEKYGDDPKKQQAEITRLWQEEGISPAGLLGCLPMFLQTPVWIALYATLFFASELRHEPAFYGVFQTISNNNWAFLADLSAPDAALPLGPLAFTPPLIGQWVGEINTVNLLPLLLGVVFYAHQKYLTPPT
ncbi:MAG: membrane protein insertase YidC, partial [Planctomycetota bacterium]